MKKLLIVVLILAGCTVQSKTIADLRLNHYQKKGYISDEGYQVLYRRLLDKARQCWGDIDSDLYADEKKGEISINFPGFITPSKTRVGIDVLGIDKKTSTVIVYNTPAWRGMAKAVGKWVTEDYQGCSWREPKPKEEEWP